MCVLLLAACGSTPKKPVIVIDQSIKKPSVQLTQAQTARYQQALTLMQQNKLDEAEPLFIELIAQQPELTGAYVNLGAIEKDAKRIPKAQEYFTKALDINPNFVDALVQKASIHQDLGEFSNAEDLLRRAEAIQPENPIVNYNLGVLYELYLQEYDLAIQYYKRYVALSSAEDIETVKRWILLLERK